MTKTIKIGVAEKLASIVGSRDVAHILKNLVGKTRSGVVDLDFQNVEFISRSAAHELLVMKEKFSKKLFFKKMINFVNVRDNVSAIFRTVAANRALPKQDQKESEMQKIDIDYLSKLVAS